jgi:hypothetical protein
MEGEPGVGREVPVLPPAWANSGTGDKLLSMQLLTLHR